VLESDVRGARCRSKEAARVCGGSRSDDSSSSSDRRGALQANGCERRRPSRRSNTNARCAAGAGPAALVGHSEAQLARATARPRSPREPPPRAAHPAVAENHGGSLHERKARLSASPGGLGTRRPAAVLADAHAPRGMAQPAGGSVRALRVAVRCAAERPTSGGVAPVGEACAVLYGVLLAPRRVLQPVVLAGRAPARRTVGEARGVPLVQRG
jgi:hypothetical protein